MLEIAHRLLSRPSVVSEGDELILRYDHLSVLLWCAVPLLSLALAFCCWRVAEWIAHRSPLNRRAMLKMRIASVCLGAFSVIFLLLVIPTVLGSEVRVSDDRLVQSAGLWFNPTLHEIPLKKVRAIVQTRKRGEFGSEARWLIFWNDQGSETFDPGDLISDNQELITAHLRKRGVLVLPGGPSE